MSFAIGAIVSPPAGGALADAYGFRVTSDVFAFLAFGFSLIYFLIIVVPTCIKKK